MERNKFNDINEATDSHPTAFGAFLEEVAELSCETNTTATGTVTIQQSLRNDLRKRGVKALVEDLKGLYGDSFDVLETREGIIIVAENEPGGWTFSWELKNTIKSLDYDPFIEANLYDEALAAKEEKKARREQERIERENQLAIKRAAKLAELERRQELLV